MGVIPDTGSEISMGKVAKAFGLESTYPPPAGSNIRLSNDLGPEAGNTAGTETKLSEDFGGLTSPISQPISLLR